ncbi:MAG: M3 family oligoendopeptidase [Anaerolineae bacterium]|nr:M3 family oligoendopeptidase [Anaerolineae bacterium]
MSATTQPAPSSPAKSAAGVAWDLSPLYASVDDPAIDRTLSSLDEDVLIFDTEYRGRIAVPGGPAAAFLLAALQSSESMSDRANTLFAFAQLLYAADTTGDANRKLVQRVEERLTALQNRALFFDLEWLQVDDAAAARLVADPALARYAHYLASARRFKPHTLSELEERLINDKDMTGVSAWSKLFTEYVASLRFKIDIDGVTREVNQSEILSLTRVADRATRQRAHESFYATLAAHQQVLSFIYDTRFQDHLVTSRVRHYGDPMQPRHLANDVDARAVDAMMTAVERNFPLAHRYWRLKARLLGLPKLELFDQYAPLGEARQRITFDEARDTVLSALERFSPQFSGMAARFFAERWIDADPRSSKRGGAFCYGSSPSKPPFILMSYNDDLRDVMTLAHELGHGMHDLLAAGQTPFSFHPSLPVAETASVFAEMLTFDAMLAKIDDPASQLKLLCAKIEDSFATVFRQTVMTRFEQKAYAARVQGRLNGEQLGRLWLEANAPYYGDTLAMTSGYELGWSYIPHFISTPFYCYAYSFGELLVQALYGMYRREGETFVGRYAAFLATGGSQSPSEQVSSMGFDMGDPDFWQVGFDELARRVENAEKLAGALEPG